MLGFLVSALLQVVELRESDVKPFVLEFCSEKTNAKRAQDLLTITLKWVDPVLMQRPLAGILGEEKEGSKRAQRALQLAGSCRVPGLYKEAVKYIGGEADQDAVMAAAADASAFAPLFDRWMKIDPTSASFKYVDDALRASRHVDLNFLSKIQGACVIAEGEKKDRAALLLAHHLGIEATDRKEILDAWPRLRDEFTKDSKGFQLSGVDLFGPGAEISGGRFVGKNVRLSKTGSIKVPLGIVVQDRPYTVKFRIYVRQPGLRVEARSSRGTWPLALQENVWVLKTGDGKRLTAPAKWDWVTVQFVVKGDLKKDGDQWAQREGGLSIYVDDTCIMEGGQYSIADEFLITSEGGEFVVAGLELIRGDKRKGK